MWACVPVRSLCVRFSVVFFTRSSFVFVGWTSTLSYSIVLKISVCPYQVCRRDGTNQQIKLHTHTHFTPSTLFSFTITFFFVCQWKSFHRIAPSSARARAHCNYNRCDFNFVAEHISRAQLDWINDRLCRL